MPQLEEEQEDRGGGSGGVTAPWLPKWKDSRGAAGDRGQVRMLEFLQEGREGASGSPHARQRQSFSLHDPLRPSPSTGSLTSQAPAEGCSLLPLSVPCTHLPTLWHHPSLLYPDPKQKELSPSFHHPLSRAGPGS